jgi:uncharacterized membrane-anchored protein
MFPNFAPFLDENSTYVLLLKMQEFIVTFNLISCLSGVLLIVAIILWFIKRIRPVMPLLSCVGLFAVSRFATFFMFLQISNGNPDSGKETGQWFNPLYFAIVVCLCCLVWFAASVLFCIVKRRKQERKIAV